MYTYTKHLVLVSWYWDTVVKRTVAKAHNCTTDTQEKTKKLDQRQVCMCLTQNQLPALPEIY